MRVRVTPQSGLVPPQGGHLETPGASGLRPSVTCDLLITKLKGMSIYVGYIYTLHHKC
jgi:hypothetical protein